MLKSVDFFQKPLKKVFEYWADPIIRVGPEMGPTKVVYTKMVYI